MAAKDEKTNDPSRRPEDTANRIVRCLLQLRAAGALTPKETRPGSGIFRWTFRSGGWPVDVDLDVSVLEMRVYHARDEVAMQRVPEPLMEQLLGMRPLGVKGTVSADDSLAELRSAVSAWKRENPRIFIRPPVKVGHPDNHNHA